MVKMIIGGEACEASDKGAVDIVNPATGAVVDRVAQATPADVDRAVASAQDAFNGWWETPPESRARILRNACVELSARSEELARLLTQEQGKPLREALLEVRRFIHTIEHYAGLAKTIRGGHVPALDDRRYGMIVKRPIGVCAAIVPWNFPLSLLGNKIGPALVAGNTLVAKPAGTTPLTDIRAVQILNEAGLPPGVLNVVPGSADVVGEALVKDPRVRKIAFTGATATGRHVMEVAARQVKRVTLELGGSDPMIVCDDADIDEAVRAASVGRFFNCGQACLAIKRLYVFEGIYGEFVEKLVRKVQQIRVGPGTEPGVTVGPLHTSRQRDEIESQVADAIERGARVLAGGSRPEGPAFNKGFFYAPTLIADVPDGARVLTEETFGPVLPIIRVSSLDEAIRRANDTIYGLGSSVWTRDLDRAMEAAHRLEAGYTWINSAQIIFDELPFGGLKQSGLGKEHGSEALDYYMETRSVVVGRRTNGTR